MWPHMIWQWSHLTWSWSHVTSAWSHVTRTWRYVTRAWRHVNEHEFMRLFLCFHRLWSMTKWIQSCTRCASLMATIFLSAVGNPFWNSLVALSTLRWHFLMSLSMSAHITAQHRSTLLTIGEEAHAFGLYISLSLYTDEDHIGRNVCIKICTEIRSDYHPYYVLLKLQ